MMNRFVLILIAVFAIAGTSQATAQCCSFGSPTPGTTNIGTVAEDNLRISLFNKYSFSENYYSGNSKLSNYGSVTEGKFNYLGLTIGYGLLEDLTIEAELGYFVNKQQDFSIKSGGNNLNYTLKNDGLNNVVLSGKYNIVDDQDLNLQWTAGVGVKIPLETEYQKSNNVVLPIDLQTSTRAYGAVFQSFLKHTITSIGLNLFLINRIEVNAKDKSDYQFGNFYSTALFASREIFRNCNAILQFRSDIREKDSQPGSTTRTGSSLIYISPQLSYNLSGFNLALLYECPIYRNYYEPQLSIRDAISLSLTYEFEL